MDVPAIRGEVLTDEKSLDLYSRDWSRYTVRPRMVTIPKDAADVEGIVEFARVHEIPVTPRGAGSNQSGSAVGEGIIILTNRLNQILSRNERRVRVQPGIVYDALNAGMRNFGLRVPYDPTSRAFCTIGGNIGTKASGIRGVKYGTADDVVRTVTFVDPVHGPVDTGGDLPPDLEQAILQLRNRIRNDREVRKVVAARENLKSSSGYNIGAFFRFDTPEEIVTHLQAGAVGTLGVLTEIELELASLPGPAALYLLFYSSLIDAVSAVPEILPLGPSALELMDKHGLALLCREGGLDCPEGATAALMVEFDSDLERSGSVLTDIIRKRRVPFLVENDPERQIRLWRVRESMLIRIRAEMETPEVRFPAFADDLVVPPKALPGFIAGLEEIFREFHTDAVIYGHAGEGNLHVRPMVRVADGKKNLQDLADRVFRTTLRFGGSLTGEHGAGRNRSRYLELEWGERAYVYFREIKQVFDPGDLMNPGVMFTTDKLTTHLEL